MKEVFLPFLYVFFVNIYYQEIKSIVFVKHIEIIRKGWGFDSKFTHYFFAFFAYSGYNYTRF